MKYNKTATAIGAALLISGASTLTSCNEKSDSTQYLEPQNLAVTNFSLKSGLGDQELDTVFFSIDLNRHVIFNADSLRKGTDVSKMVASIKFGSTVSEAMIEMNGGSRREGVIDYRENPNDSIDFTGDVTLRIKAAKDEIGTSYRIKVNVHKLDPDSLYWNEAFLTRLPSRLPSPLDQKTVTAADGTVISLIKESDGTHTLSTCGDLASFNWQKNMAALPFEPDIASLAAAGEALWILDTAGHLHTSPAPYTDWRATGLTWHSVIGAYNNTVVGLEKTEGNYRFAQYPRADLNPEQIPEDFPLSGSSNFVTLANKWTLSPVAFFTGGRKADGSLSDATWAFDGTRWIKLSHGGIPPLEGASIIPYYNFRPSAKGDVMLKYNVWLMLGGSKQDGSFNRTVYISYDNGVNWAKGAVPLQLPDCIPAMTRCDNTVAENPMQSDISDIWKIIRKSATRAEYELDGNVIKWGCPYIYLFGGFSPEGKLYDTVWKGTLTRLTFTPIF